MKKVIIVICSLIPLIVHSQNPNSDYNPITTSVPFIAVPDDARGVGLGMAGSATSADINSMYWNPAKYAFITEDQEEQLVDYPKDLGFSLSYHRTYYKWFDKTKYFHFNSYKILGKQTIATSFRIYDWGEDISFVDENGYEVFHARPLEFAADLAYSRRFSNNFSSSIALRFIYSDLTRGHDVEGMDYQPGISIAADLSLLYRKNLNIAGLNKSLFSFGLNISNIGNKISYYKEGEYKDFIPTNLRLGGSFFIEKGIHGLTFTIDLNKLLVPTPPIRTDSVDSSGHYIITDGMEDDVSVLRGMVQSFYDAPNGFKEELQEITYSLGLEYTIFRMVSFRTGYFREHENKGGREYFNLGFGFKYKFVGLDVTYSIIPDKVLDWEGNPSYERNIIYANLIFQIRTSKKKLV